MSRLLYLIEKRTRKIATIFPVISLCLILILRTYTTQKTTHNDEILNRQPKESATTSHDADSVITYAVPGITFAGTLNNASIISHYFQTLSSTQLALLNRFGELCRDWNEKINLISRKDIANIYLHHILHSLAIARIITFANGSEILDFGTGGGFPGLPLAIFFPRVSFHLVDSVEKKIRAVEAIVSALGLKNVVCTCTRGEQIKKKYDFIVARGVTNLPSLHKWIKGKLTREQKNALPNGLLYLRGDKSGESLPWTVQWYPLRDFFSETFFSEKYLVHAYPQYPNESAKCR